MGGGAGARAADAGDAAGSPTFVDSVVEQLTEVRQGCVTQCLKCGTASSLSLSHAHTHALTCRNWSDASMNVTRLGPSLRWCLNIVTSCLATWRRGWQTTAPALTHESVR